MTKNGVHLSPSLCDENCSSCFLGAIKYILGHFFQCNSILNEFHFVLFLVGIGKKFCTWHGSCAVVACVKFLSDIIISNWVAWKTKFHRIWINVRCKNHSWNGPVVLITGLASSTVPYGPVSSGPSGTVDCSSEPTYNGHSAATRHLCPPTRSILTMSRTLHSNLSGSKNW